jgi:hypothetical protein
MTINLFALNHKSYIAEIFIIEEVGLDILNDPVFALFVYAAGLQEANVKHIKIIEPLVPIEAAKNIDHFLISCSGRMPLPWLRNLGEHESVVITTFSKIVLVGNLPFLKSDIENEEIVGPASAI